MLCALWEGMISGSAQYTAYIDAYEKHNHEVVGFAYGYVRDWELAQDYAAETWERAYRKWHLFKGGNLLGWLRTMMLNIVRRHLEKLATNPEPVPLKEHFEEGMATQVNPGTVQDSGRRLLSVDDNVDLLIANCELDGPIFRALKAMHPQYAEALLYKAQYCDEQVAAQALGITHTAYHVRLHRARLEIRDMLQYVL